MELMTSGAFAQASGLSRKALRLYDELGSARIGGPAGVEPRRYLGTVGGEPLQPGVGIGGDPDQVEPASSPPGWGRGPRHRRAAWP